MKIKLSEKVLGVITDSVYKFLCVIGFDFLCPLKMNVVEEIGNMILVSTNRDYPTTEEVMRLAKKHMCSLATREDLAWYLLRSLIPKDPLRFFALGSTTEINNIEMVASNVFVCSTTLYPIREVWDSKHLFLFVKKE